ncbi:MAG TPA: hypothetical protein VFH99_01750 [Candidatus Saccharimonadales bacterium]|nr:hypothetical protein [Candidatus Saccharimonadales bacterium]
MNFVMGPGIGHPHHPKKHKPHKCKCHKCGCHKKKPKPKTPLSCEAQGLINGPNGTCVTQIVTVTPKQECEANNHSTTGCTQETTTVVINCGNYSSGNSGTVEQGDNCTQKEEENTCVDSSCNSEEEPCGCKEPKPEIRITSMTELNQIPFGKISQEVHIGTYASESGGVLTVDPGIGSVSPCGSSSPKGVFTAEVPSGSSEACVVFTAPEDGDEPEYMVVTVTACIGSVCAEKIQKVKITYDQYPG